MQLISGKTFVGKIDIEPGLQLRLNAFAHANKTELPKMIHLALRYAVADENKSPKMFAPDEGEIINRRP